MSDLPLAERHTIVTAHRLTRIYMVLKGAVYVLIGVSWVVFPSPGRMEGIDWLSFVTPQMVATLWAVTGVLAVLGGVTTDRRITRAGWVALIIAPFIIAAYFLGAWVLFLMGAGGAERGIVTTVSYVGFVMSAYVMSRIHSATLHPVKEDL